MITAHAFVQSASPALNSFSARPPMATKSDLAIEADVSADLCPRRFADMVGFLMGEPSTVPPSIGGRTFGMGRDQSSRLDPNASVWRGLIEEILNGCML